MSLRKPDRTFYAERRRASPSEIDVLRAGTRGPKQSAQEIAPYAKLASWTALWRTSSLLSRVSISFSRRMRNALGRCVPAQGVVRLNSWALQGNPKLLDEVLCHELAHVAAFELHGPKVRPHGAEWCALMRAAGFEPRVRTRLSRDVQSKLRTWRAERSLYEHRCPVCLTSRLARRPVPRWRCASCASAGLEAKLVIVKRSGRPN